MAIRDSADQLRELLTRRILVLDGAMGTVLQTKNLTAEDFGGPEYEGCNESSTLHYTLLQCLDAGLSMRQGS